MLHTHKYKKQQYVEKIVTYTEILIEFPMLDSNEIIILSVIHSSRDVNKVFENLKLLFK